MTSPAAPTLDTDTVVAVLTTDGVQDTQIKPALTDDGIREMLTYAEDRSSAAIGIPFGHLAYVQMTAAGAKVLADAGVAVQAYEAETITSADLTANDADLYGEIILTDHPTFLVKVAITSGARSGFDFYAGCEAVRRDVSRANGTVRVTTFFDSL